MTKSMSYKRYRGILFQKVASGYEWPFVQPGSSKNALDFCCATTSKKQTIGFNENGYYTVFQTDRYGFKNPDSEWNKKTIEFLLIGDSFTHGLSVNEQDTIGGNLRKLIPENNGVLSLGQASNGTLIEYATLREYLPLVNARRVICLYYEANDLINLSDELKNEIPTDK